MSFNVARLRDLLWQYPADHHVSTTDYDGLTLGVFGPDGSRCLAEIESFGDVVTYHYGCDLVNCRKPCPTPIGQRGTGWRCTRPEGHPGECGRPDMSYPR